MVEIARKFGPECITVCIDFDERVIRMGFGDLAATKALRDEGIVVNSTPGLRTGLVIVDHHGYIFTPTALYLETDNRPAEAPNAMRLSEDQVKEALARLSPAAKAMAIAFAGSEEEKRKITEQAVEVPSVKVADKEFVAVGKRLEEAPPVPFDIARQVHVFNSYLQYVELKLTGAAIERHRLAIPSSIQTLGGSKDLDGRLRTTFDQEKVKKDLQAKLDASRKQIVDYYVPSVTASPPDAMLGRFTKIGEAEARAWLDDELGLVFPEAKDLIANIQLDVHYKDVTFETLNRLFRRRNFPSALPGTITGS